MKTRKKQLQFLIEEYNAKLLYEKASLSIARVDLLNEAYGPDLLEECRKKCLLLMEESTPAAIKSMTVQEVLDTIETLEKTQEERDKVIGIIEALVCYQPEVVTWKTLDEKAVPEDLRPGRTQSSRRISPGLGVSKGAVHLQLTTTF